MKISIVYVSKSGNTEKTGKMIRDGILGVNPEAEVRLMNLIDEANLDKAFIGESSAVIFGTPTYVAGGCWQIKKLMDTVFDIPFAGKLAGCYATANFVQGGGDLAIQNTLEMALVKGMLVYSSGISEGHPYIHLGPVALAGHLEDYRNLFTIYGSRMAKKAMELFG